MQEQISNIAEDALRLWKEVIYFYNTTEDPQGSKFNQLDPIPSLEIRLNQLDAKVYGCLHLITQMSSFEDTDSILVPFHYIGQLNTSVTQLFDQIETAHKETVSVKTNGVQSLDPINWTLVELNTGQSLNFASHLQRMFPALNNCLEQYYNLQSIIGSSNFNLFSGSLKEYSKNSEEVRAKLKYIRGAHTRAVSLLKTMEENNSDVSEQIELANSNKKSIDKIKELAEASISEVADSKSSIQDVLNSSANLKSEVEEYESAFSEFKSDLNKNQEAFAEHKRSYQELFNSFDEQRDKISNIIDRSDNMLQGATNAGLSSTFDKILEKLTIKLFFAQAAFYISIFILFLTLLPLAFYLYGVGVNTGLDTAKLNLDGGGIFEFISATIEGDKFSPISTIALASLMVPSIWLTKFTARRHHDLFQLREHYQYKFSLSMAVDGFKKQAPEYEEEIAAATFESLIFNPADKLVEQKTPEALPNPILNAVLKKLGITGTGKSSS